MTNYDHIIYKNNPVLFKSYVNKICTVTATDESRHTGIVYTVDPITESIILIQNSNTPEQCLKVVSGHAVQRVEIESDVVDKIPQLFQTSNSAQCQKLVSERKKEIISILRENRFPIKENGDVIEMENVFSIKPPYGPENCASTNPAVLARIHSILWRVSCEDKQ